MNALALVCRGTMWLGERLVPGGLRERWRQDWLGSFWTWMLDASEQGGSEAKRALANHTWSAAREAFRARFRSEQSLQAWRHFRGSPEFFLATFAVLFATLACASGGFSATRLLVHGLPYKEPARLMILAQGPPILGTRLGFLDSQVATVRAQSQTLEGIATYNWGRTQFRSPRRTRDVVAAHVGPGFFQVLGVETALGKGLEDGPPNELRFVASDDFFRKELKGDPLRIGQKFEVGGKSMTLAGVLPPGVSFLAAPISIWTFQKEDSPSVGIRWWLGLRGTVARLRPGATPATAEKELSQLLYRRTGSFRNFRILTTGLAMLFYQTVWMYGSVFVACALGIIAWTVFRIYLDRKRGVPIPTARRYWGFFFVKSSVLLVLLFLFTLEVSGSLPHGATGGGVWWGWELLSQWVFFIAATTTLFWIWRDQRNRCPMCLHRLQQPIRIGEPGRILLDTTGEEVMCPHGHGSIYTAESVLGSEMSNKWLGFDSVL